MDQVELSALTVVWTRELLPLFAAKMQVVHFNFRKINSSRLNFPSRIHHCIPSPRAIYGTISTFEDFSPSNSRRTSTPMCALSMTLMSIPQVTEQSLFLLQM